MSIKNHYTATYNIYYNIRVDYEALCQQVANNPSVGRGTDRLITSFLKQAQVDEDYIRHVLAESPILTQQAEITYSEKDQYIKLILNSSTVIKKKAQ
jgi:hypothetical protein